MEFNQEIAAGAAECVEALKQMKFSTQNLPEECNDEDDEISYDVHYGIQASNAKALAAKFGPLTPRQEGIFRALAEYIHFSMLSGEPALDMGWQPHLVSSELQHLRRP